MVPQLPARIHHDRHLASATLYSAVWKEWFFIAYQHRNHRIHFFHFESPPMKSRRETLVMLSKLHEDYILPCFQRLHKAFTLTAC